jgi:hypothetical protein
MIMRITWGKVHPGRWGEYEQAYKATVVARSKRAADPDAQRKGGYVIVEDAVEGASLADLTVGAKAMGDTSLPARIEVPIDGTPVTYRMVGALARTRDEATRVRGELAAFEDVALLNRYESERTVLRVEGVPEGVRAFGSVLDLTTGHERPAALSRVAQGVVELALSPCPTRTLLQVRWPLVK